jgi:hypothetical protein
VCPLSEVVSDLLVLAAAGLAVVAREMGTAMTVLRYAGAAYLVWTCQDARREAGPPSVRALRRQHRLGRPEPDPGPDLPNVVGTVLTPPQVGLLAAVIVAVEALVIGAHVLTWGGVSTVPTTFGSRAR